MSTYSKLSNAISAEHPTREKIEQALKTDLTANNLLDVIAMITAGGTVVLTSNKGTRVYHNLCKTNRIVFVLQLVGYAEDLMLDGEWPCYLAEANCSECKSADCHIRKLFGQKNPPPEYIIFNFTIGQ